MPLDHIGFTVADFPKSKTFYAAVLAPLDMHITGEGENWATFGKDGRTEFWLGDGTPTGPMHLAFAAETRAAVQGFHKAALEAGGRDNGAPGIRGHYSPNYYGAFVFDPDGHNIEAVCHDAVG